MVKIQRVNYENLDLAIPLFDAYRIFYKQPSDVGAAKSFLSNRLSKNESVIFLASENNLGIGFVQLYPTFSSVSLESFYILNDLFVSEKFRGKRVGQKLLEKAKEHCISMNYKGLALETANDNPAQELYERLGWKKDTSFLHYFWTSPKNE